MRSRRKGPGDSWPREFVFMDRAADLGLGAGYLHLRRGTEIINQLFEEEIARFDIDALAERQNDALARAGLEPMPSVTRRPGICDLSCRKRGFTAHQSIAARAALFGLKAGGQFSSRKTGHWLPWRIRTVVRRRRYRPEMDRGNPRENLWRVRGIHDIVDA